MYNQIITGDCRQTLASWPADSFQIIFTSPPYNVGLNYDGYHDRLEHGQFVDFNRQWLGEAYRVASEGARFYAIIGEKMLFWFKELAEEAGWSWSQKLVWCKPNIVAGPTTVSNDWAYMAEDILVFRKGKRTKMLSADRWTQSWTFNWFVETVPQSNHAGGRIHPAQLPFSLCLKILARTPGQRVLDPFCGSGQVLRAARALGRDWLGIELVPEVAARARQFVNVKDPGAEPITQMELLTL